MVKGLDLGAAWRFDQKEASDHRLVVVSNERTRHHDFDAETAGVREEGLVGIVVFQPRRQRIRTINRVNNKQHHYLRFASRAARSPASFVRLAERFYLPIVSACSQVGQL